jgi:hypothetical protein
MNKTIIANEVPIIVVEDITFDWPTAGVPLGRGGFHFSWHPTLHCRIRSHQALERFLGFFSGQRDEEWGLLPAPAIVVLDLQYSFPRLSPTQDAELTRWLVTPYRAAPGQRHGLYVLGTLVQNTAWHGLVVVATTQGHPTIIKGIIADFSQRFPHPQIEVVTSEGAISEGQNARNIIELAVTRFLHRFGSLDERLWPSHTNDWFSDNAAVVQHDYPSPQSQSWSAAVEALRAYLHTLLGFAPPEHWFNPETGQLPWLWKDLMGLVGAYSVTQGCGIKNLTLGNVVLLLAVACKAAAQTWIHSIRWNARTAGVQFLPPQTREQARKVVDTLVGDGTDDTGLFAHLVRHSKSSHDNLVDKVILDDGYLRILLAHNFLEKDKDNPASTPLLEKIAYYTGVDGNASIAFRQFEIAVAASQGVKGRRASCAVPFYFEQPHTVLGILPCPRGSSSMDGLFEEVPDSPPEDYGTILAADDDGYDPYWEHYLIGLGYGVQVVTTQEKAREELAANPADVFVCDLQWGSDPQAGHALMRLAQEKACKLILAMSAVPLQRGDVPEAHDSLGGTHVKTVAGAYQLHRRIWACVHKKVDRGT